MLLHKARHKLSAFARIPRFRKLEFFCDWYGLHILWVSLRLFGFKRTARWTKAIARRGSSHPAIPSECQIKYAKESARLVDAAARNSFFGKNCLRESMILWLQLRRRGIHATMRIGAPKGEVAKENRWEAHAWLEIAGEPGTEIINDRPDVAERFAVFSGFEDAWNQL